MGGVAGNVEKDLDVCLGDLDTKVGGEDLSDNDRPLIERVMGLGPILPGRAAPGEIPHDEELDSHVKLTVASTPWRPSCSPASIRP